MLDAPVKQRRRWPFVAAAGLAVAGAAAVALALTQGDGGSDWRVDWSDTSRIEITGDGVTTIPYTADELDVLQSAGEAEGDIEDDILEEISTAFVFGDYAAVCEMYSVLADATTSSRAPMLMFVEDGGPGDIGIYILGQAVRFGAVDSVKRECSSEIAAYQAASSEALGS